jgi:hypothetical protein
MTGTQLLFDNELAPITSEYGFVEGTAADIADWFATWDSSIHSKRGVTHVRRRVTGTLRDMLLRLEPLTSVERRRFLFVPTAGPWTAYFDNGWQGSGAAGLSFVAAEMHARALRVVAILDTMGTGRAEPSKKGRYGASILELYGPEKTEFLNYIRTISLANDGGQWRFDVAGEVQPFEETDAYKARSLKDRFGLDRLRRYLEALGVRAFDASFFKNEGILVEREGPLLPNVRQYSLSEARSAFGYGG